MRNKLLLVDDDKEFREEFRQCFSEYEIVEASDGREALEILRKPNEIGLVILDVQMPGESGTAVLAEIKTMSPGLCTIILTGFSSEHTAIDALKSHADDYIQKPFEVDLMREMIERFLGSGTVKKLTGKPVPLDDKIEHVKEYVARNCYKKVGLTDAARAVSLCPKYLSRIFKEATGMGFSEYRLAVQMEKAKDLLVSNGCNVSEVSDKLGYRNPESFVRQFKKLTGHTPTEYRAKNGAVRTKSPRKPRRRSR